MTALAIDVEASLAATVVWAGWGDEVARSAHAVHDDVRSCSLEAVGPHWESALIDVSQECWTASAGLRLLLERVVAADRLHTPLGGIDVAVIAALLDQAARRVAILDSRCDRSLIGGDLGQTSCTELRTPYDVHGDDPLERGRNLVVRALQDSAAGYRIGPDEFEVVQFDDGRYLVVLPGVTDLSDVDLGLSDTHRTVRDLDRFAVASSRSSAVDDNRYALIVWQALAERGIAPGSELVIIGHSFGADTALDLAGDPHFNGPGGYEVTHVVAAGYFSQPQLSSVPPTTSVLVLENHRDAAVIAEAAGQAGPIDVVTAGLDAIGIGWDVGWALAHGDADAATGRDADVLTLEPSVSAVGDHHVVAVFEGGSHGAGHHQSNYIAFVEATDDPLVTGFLASVGTPRAIGPAYAVDVSVPR